jgi:hypothetical protein
MYLYFSYLKFSRTGLELGWRLYLPNRGSFATLLQQKSFFCGRNINSVFFLPQIVVGIGVLASKNLVFEWGSKTNGDVVKYLIRVTFQCLR